MLDVAVLAERVVAGDRRALARAITLVESTRSDHRKAATELLNRLMPATGGAVRVGISGAPGAGKSTFIEALGMHVIGDAREVAVLAVDPSSQRSGGSILGDKTRMEELSRESKAFIRPSPSGGTLGGVARRTREAMFICEAAGFDLVLIETVGVGQSEVAVAAMVDMFVLLLSPAAGDELQGVKRGIVELADLVVVNKCDGDLVAAATRTAADYANAVHFLRPRSSSWQVGVVTASAIERRGFDEIWEAVKSHRDAIAKAGDLEVLRAEQNCSWLWSEVTDGLVERLRGDEEISQMLASLETAVRSGSIPPTTAAQQILAKFLG